MMDVSKLGGGKGVLITVKDVPTLVKAQGGRLGEGANWFLPDTIENEVYKKMADEILSGMRAKGVDADVKVVVASGYKKAPTPDFTRGIFVGAGAVGVGWILLYAIKRFF